ncbi:MAG: type II secretion system F family protein [Salinirussus sp.]
MVSPLWIAPVIILLASLAAWLGSHASRRIERGVTRLARGLFGRFVNEHAERKRRLEAAYVRESYVGYATTTYLYTLLGFLGGAAGGAMLTAGVLAVLEPLVHALSGLPTAISVPLGLTRDFELGLSGDLWGLIVIAGALLIGAIVAPMAYVLRWKLPDSNAEVRRRSIDAGLPRTTAFMFALSRGGLEFPEVVRILGRNDAVFGEAAREMRIVVREMDLFGRDMISAVRRMSNRTPSEQFKTFGENLASVLQSGQDLAEFLRNQYDRFQQEAEDRQREILELLATIAEGYVTVFVAGVLFLMTILLVFGLTTADTLWALRVMTYLIIPLANAGFMVFLAGRLEALGIGRGSGAEMLETAEDDTPVQPSPRVERRRADGGAIESGDARQQLARYDRLERLRSLVQNPIRAVIERPTTVFYITVPLTLIVFLARLPSALQGVGVSVRILDDLIVQSFLFLAITYAIARYLYRRRIDRIEAATPELLERLASLNEAGMTVTEGIHRVRGSDLGVLTPEVDRISRDVEYGANIDDALVRFGRRVRTTAVTRVVTLLTHALRASGRMGDVLRIAATQARADLRMRRQRRREMFTYLIVIYIAFLVFLVIVFAVNEVLIPSLPESVPTPDPSQTSRLGVDTSQFARLGGVDKAAYSLVFFHTALIQAVASGLVAGQLGEGTLRDGAKHAAVLVGLAYIAFILLSSPVASIGGTGAISTGDTLVVPSASLSDGGFVVAYAEGVNGTQQGQSEYLPAGTHRNVRIDLRSPIRSDRTITLVTHLDTDGDERLSFEPPYIPQSGQVDRPYPGIADDATPGVEIEVEVAG